MPDTTDPAALAAIMAAVGDGRWEWTDADRAAMDGVRRRRSPGPFTLDSPEHQAPPPDVAAAAGRLMAAVTADHAANTGEPVSYGVLEAADELRAALAPFTGKAAGA